MTSNNYATNSAEFDNAQIPPELQELIDNELHKDETIEWIAQPIPCFFSKEVMPLFLFGIAWMTMMICCVLSTSIKNIFDIIFITPFILVGVGLFSISIWKYRASFKTVYAITNQRVVILEKQLFSFEIISYEPDEIDSLYRKQRKDRTGDVFVFKNIRNVKEVEQKLRNLKKTAKPDESDQDEEEDDEY